MASWPDPIRDDFPTPEQERQEDRQDTFDGVTMLAVFCLLAAMIVSAMVWVILVMSQWLGNWFLS